MTTPPRVRFAPSPTGYLHVGGARTALYNWLFARNQGGVFVLRIEDTDRARSSDEMSEAILEGMRWLGLEWDEGPFHQADGLERHRAAALRLLEEGKAYRCFVTPEELEARRAAAAKGGHAIGHERAWSELPPGEAERRAAAGEPHTLRFRVPEGVTEWSDAVHGSTRVPNDSIEDFVILRSDGTAVYNLAVVSDDAETRITHVIRGDDHLANTPKQILLYRALGAPLPVFAHLPMILGADGKRLSKRHGATAVGEYQRQGILPQALLNFLALLGWNAGDDLEVMSVAEMVELFSLDRVNRKSAVFDPEKLEWMNAQHLMRLPAEEVLEQIAPLLVDEGLATPIDLADRRDWYLRLVRLLQPRARTLPEFVPWARPFLAAEVEYEPAARAKHWKDAGEAAARLEAAGDALAVLDLWEPEAIEQALRDRAAELGVGFGKLVHPLRLALTGSGSSPGINDVVGLLGRERVAARIRAARLHLAQPVPRV